MTQPKDERRRFPRRRALKTGRIVFNNRHSAIDCAVRNLSAHGALLLLPNVVDIPNDFELYIDGTYHPAHVVWRKSNGSLGVTWN
jgi:PilZ domain